MEQTGAQPGNDENRAYLCEMVLKGKCAICPAPHKTEDCSQDLKSGVDNISKMTRRLERRQAMQTFLTQLP